jgi:competence protein ComGF
MYEKACPEVIICIPISIEKYIIVYWLTSNPTHLTSCTTTISNLYFANLLATICSVPALQRLQTAHVPNLLLIFHCLCHSKVSAQIQGPMLHSVTSWFLKSEEFLAPCPTQAGGQPCQLSVTAYSIY